MYVFQTSDKLVISLHSSQLCVQFMSVCCIWAWCLVNTSDTVKHLYLENQAGQYDKYDNNSVCEHYYNVALKLASRATLANQKMYKRLNHILQTVSTGSSALNTDFVLSKSFEWNKFSVCSWGVIDGLWLWATAEAFKGDFTLVCTSVCSLQSVHVSHL